MALVPAVLMQCNDAAFERNVQQIVALGAHSHRALKEVAVVHRHDYHRLARHRAFYTDPESFEQAGVASRLMRKYVDRKVISTEAFLKSSPLYAAFKAHIVAQDLTPP
jgi:D-amino-acid dehydrogenase